MKPWKVLCATVVLFSVISYANASLLDTTVSCSTTNPGLACDSPSNQVVDPGSEFIISFNVNLPNNAFEGLDVNVGDNTIEFTSIFIGGFGPGVGSSVTIDDLTWGDTTGQITGFTLEQNGFDLPTDDDITFGSDIVTVNLAGTQWQATPDMAESILITLDTTHTPGGTVAAPATFPLFLSVLAGLGFIGWRRQRSALAA